MKTAILAGVDDAVSARIQRELEARGWQVHALHTRWQPDAALAVQSLRGSCARADMVILHTDDGLARENADILEPIDDALMAEEYDRLCLWPLRVLNALMPFLQAGEGKRICLVTTCEGSQSLCRDTRGYGRRMALAALNLAMKQLFNQLHPLGYTFRLYGGGGQTGEYAAEFFTRDRSYEPEDPLHSDENRLVLHNEQGGEIPW